ncbi:MAG: hypothetical protein IKQ61_05800 [Spirochaetales bacterium]|nr:hypothetical protein [Spirochaetales bacterium]
MAFAPIALFVYNRPDHTRRTLEALSQNELADQSHLFIFADGPKQNVSEDQLDRIRQTRAVIREKQWCGKVDIIEADKNKGLAQSIIDGVTKIVNEFGKIIVLEDDLLTGKYFLQYMNDGLDVYENENKVVEIHGFMYSHRKELPETFFIKGADCWGWATWKRAWALFNPDGQYLLDELQRRKLEYVFDFDNTYGYVDMLKGQIAGRNNSWAIRWLASAFLADCYTLYPSKSLVKNFGFDGSGTHCGDNDYLQNDEVYNERILVHKIDAVVENRAARKVFKQEFASNHNFFVRCKRGVKKVLSKIRSVLCRK